MSLLPQGFKPMKLVLLTALLGISVSNAFAQSAAIVKLVRGKVDAVSAAGSRALQLDDTVEAGAVIKTQEKSFARLVFLDKSQINIGPLSEMKIERFDGKDSGIVSVVQGKIRSAVTKDYLEMKDKNRSKLFIKTPNAVLGVRGTDFLVSVAQAATSTVLFEGEIVFNRIDPTALSSSDLEAVVERGVRIFPGEFSVLGAKSDSPTVPSLLNVNQLEKLETNDTFTTDRAPSSQATTSTGSLVPPGLSGAVVANTEESIKGLLVASAVSPIEVPKSTDPAGGISEAGRVRPANGSFVHLESGVVIAPSSDAVLDPVTNTFIGGTASGSVSEDGSYRPPAGVEITPDGKLSVVTQDASGQTVKTVVSAPPPVVTASSPGLAQVITPPPATAPPVWDPALNRPAPNGGIQGVNDPQRTTDAFTDVTLRYQ